MSGEPSEIVVRGACEHNLKSVNVREQQVLAALRANRNTIGDITEAIYIDVSAALKRVAEFSVQRIWKSSNETAR